MPSVLHRIRMTVAPVEFVRPGGYAEIWKITWPLIITNASNTVMLILNRVFLAKNQLEDMMASVTAGQLFFCLCSFFLIMTSFTGTIVAQHYGNKDKPSCIKTAWNGLYFGTLLSVFLMLFLPMFGDWLFHFGSLSDSIKQRESQYFLFLVPSACFACMEAPLLTFFTATGRTRIVAVTKIVTCLVSVPLNYIMIFGKLGLPSMGIEGAGMATSVAGFSSLMVAVIAFLVQDQNVWASRRRCPLDWSIFRKLVVFGAPGGLQACVRSAAFASVLFFFGCLGATSLTAATLAMTINNLAFIPLLGLVDSTSVITGKYIGERSVSTAGAVSGRSMCMLSVYMTFIAIVYLFMSDQLIRFFAPETEAGVSFENVASLVRIIMLFQIVQNFFDGFRFIIFGSLRGAGDTRFPLILALMTAWFVQVPMAVLLTIVFPVPIWLAWGGSITLYVIVDCIVIYCRKRSGAWKKIKVIDLSSPGKSV